jgi:pimeloyl-ACP methyl ester carboxylesterase
MDEARQSTTNAIRTSKLQRTDAPDISYDELGSGETALLFTPGWCVSRQVFAALPALCAQRHRVLSIDWRGHGDSGAASGDFGTAELVQDALDVIRMTGVGRVIPIAQAHSGWIALELRRRLGSAVPRMVLLNWLVAEPPPTFMAALRDLQRADAWERTRNTLFSMWTQGAEHTKLEEFVVRDMGSYDFAMWSRSAREIERAYARHGSPLQALAAMSARIPVLHLYAQPDDADLLSFQQAYARRHTWFQVHKLAARSQFPMFEVPEEMAGAITRFTAPTRTGLN